MTQSQIEICLHGQTRDAEMVIFMLSLKLEVNESIKGCGTLDPWFKFPSIRHKRFWFGQIQNQTGKILGPWSIYFVFWLLRLSGHLSRLAAVVILTKQKTQIYVTCSSSLYINCCTVLAAKEKTFLFLFGVIKFGFHLHNLYSTAALYDYIKCLTRKKKLTDKCFLFFLFFSFMLFSFNSGTE